MTMLPESYVHGNAALDAQRLLERDDPGVAEHEAHLAVTREAIDKLEGRNDHAAAWATAQLREERTRVAEALRTRPRTTEARTAVEECLAAFAAACRAEHEATTGGELVAARADRDLAGRALYRAVHALNEARAAVGRHFQGVKRLKREHGSRFGISLASNAELRAVAHHIAAWAHPYSNAARDAAWGQGAETDWEPETKMPFVIADETRFRADACFRICAAMRWESFARRRRGLPYEHVKSGAAA